MNPKQRYIQEHPRRKELIEKGKLARFYGEPIGDLGREDLFMLIGWLGEEKKRDRKQKVKEQEMKQAFQGRPL